MKAGPQLTALEGRIDYAFKSKDLGMRALTHSSYGDGQRKVRHNERLEFLGDRILGLLTAERLFALADAQEGEMARKLNALVRKEACAKVARACGLGDALLMSVAEERQGGREKTSILGNAVEALMAAMYLDGGMPAVVGFYDRFWGAELARITNMSMKDPKTELQEKAFAAVGHEPSYAVIERSGPDHRPLFVIEVTVENLGSAKGTGKSKKDAERYAARHLLESKFK